MRFTSNQTQTGLAFAGSLPFLAAALSLSMGYSHYPMIGEVAQAIVVYALVIAAFMAGSQWGQQFDQSDVWAKRLQWYSNLNAVGLWLAFILLPYAWLLVALIVSFLGALWLDQQLYRAAMMTRHYWQIRWILTSIVVLSLLVVGLSV